jgi:Tfp pilus assembly protein PilV
MKRGFTLIETLVIVLVFSLIVSGMLGLLNYAKVNYNTNLIRLSLQQQTRRAMDLLSREIREASWDSIPNSFSFNKDDSFDTFKFKKVSYFVEKNTASSKSLSQLVRTCLTCPKKVVANDITKLEAEKEDRTIKITVEASKDFKVFGEEKNISFALVEKVFVRNL